jgi:hypothetical protein
VPLKLQKAVRSITARGGDSVEFTVASDVRSPDGSVAIAAGSPAFGTVASAHRAGPFGSPGSVAIKISHVHSYNGVRVPLKLRGEQSATTSRGANRRGLALGTGLLVGIVMGIVVALGDLFDPNASSSGPTVAFIAAGALSAGLWQGGEAGFPEGREVVAIVESDTRLALSMPPPAERP